MSGLTEFLLARIAEDETRAEAIEDGQYTLIDEYPADQQILWLSERMLRECEAKRRMVDFIFREAESVDGEWGDSHDAAEIRAEMCGDAGDRMATEGLLILASVYADHPDYLPEWRPTD